MRVLVTAIGSMSSRCVIESLKKSGAFVVGCDIYPGKWHFETRLCNAFEQAAFATHVKEYFDFLRATCAKYQLDTILPLTDLEIDVLNEHRGKLEGIQLAMPNDDVLSVARNKFRLFKTFEADKLVPSLKTILLSGAAITQTEIKYPCIAKPYNGRSSEGVIRNALPKDIEAIANKDVYILQEQKEGNICVVDFVRSGKSGVCAMVAREELLRTKNGAGTTVRVFDDPVLSTIVRHIGDVLEISSAVNMEFIHGVDGKYYLIDINPRFSAGIAFTEKMGYDIVNNHFRALLNEPIDGQIKVEEKYIVKHWKEDFL